MRVLILGGTGMLGSAVVKHFKTVANTEVFWTTRNEDLHERLYEKDLNCLFFDALCEPWDTTLWDLLDGSEPDYVINCIGIIKPHMKDNICQAITVNALFPHQLAFECKIKGTKLIHITTDCVFSGLSGFYTECSSHDCLDDYGKTKSLGEPIEKAMVIRTSIIGPEPASTKCSLLEWVRSQCGKEIQGYTNHLWNGITTYEYARVCEKIISKDLWEAGLFHVHSPNTVDKYELVSAIAQKYKIECTVYPTECLTAINRTLTTYKPEFLQKLEIPSIYKQIEELPD